MKELVLNSKKVNKFNNRKLEIYKYNNQDGHAGLDFLFFFWKFENLCTPSKFYHAVFFSYEKSYSLEETLIAIAHSLGQHYEWTWQTCVFLIFSLIHNMFFPESTHHNNQKFFNKYNKQNAFYLPWSIFFDLSKSGLTRKSM